MMLVCLLLPGMVWAATPTVTWDLTHPNPFGVAEPAPLQTTDYPVKIKTSSALTDGQTLAVNVYWFSLGAAADEPLRYDRHFTFAGVNNQNKDQSNGSFTVTLTGNGSKTVFDNFKVRTKYWPPNQLPRSLFLILSPGSGYSLANARHREVVISEDNSKISVELASTAVLGSFMQLYETVPTEETGRSNNTTVIWQGRVPGSQAWEELSRVAFCDLRARRPCYNFVTSDLGKEVRALFTYYDPNGIETTVVSNVLGPITKNKVSFSQSTYHVNESEGSVDITVNLAHRSINSITVQISATTLTATGNDVDYSGLTYSVTIPVGSKSATFSIPITKDNTVTNDSEADSETFRLDIFDGGDFPDWAEKGRLTYVEIHNYKLPVISLTEPDRVVDERTYAGLALSSNRDIPYADAVSVLGKAKAKNGTTFDLSGGGVFGRVGLTSTDRVPFASEDTLYCAWLPQQSRHYTVSDRSATEPATGWSICPSGVTILVKNTGTTAQEEANQRANPDPEPPKVMNSINDCVHSGNLSLHQVEDFAQNRSPADNRFNRILSALYERTTPAPLTASEANVFYQNNRGGDNESFYEAVYNTLTCIEAL